MNTQTKGIPMVIFNPLNIAREDVVEASVEFPQGLPKAVRVTGRMEKMFRHRFRAERSSSWPVCLLSAMPCTTCSLRTAPRLPHRP